MPSAVKSLLVMAVGNLILQKLLHVRVLPSWKLRCKTLLLSYSALKIEQVGSSHLSAVRDIAQVHQAPRAI